jgi:hypothetical protein
MSIKVAFNQTKSIFDETNSRNTMGRNDIWDEFNTIVNANATDFRSRVAKFGTFLRVLKNSQYKLNQDSFVLNTLFEKNNVIDTNTRENKIFFDILSDKRIQEFIFEFNYIDDFKNINTYDDLYKIYMDSKDYIEMSDNTERVLSYCDNTYSGNNSSVFDKAISLGHNAPASVRVMSRSNNCGGLKTVDFPFNPF